MAKPTAPETIRLIGGRLCLDFANSVDWSEDDEPVAPEVTDALTTPDRLARWGERTGLLPGGGAVDAAELARARELRDAVYRAFSALAAGHAPQAADLDAIRRSHAEGVAAGEWAGPGEAVPAGSDASAGAHAAAEREGAWRITWPRSDPRRVRWAVAADA